MSWSEAPPRRRRGLLAGGSALLLLAGCGFQVRRPPRLAFGSIHLAGFPPRSPLADELRRELLRQVRVLDQPGGAEVQFEVLEDRRERSVVASTAAAQVRELRLRLFFSFRAGAPTGRELIPRAELLLSRDMSWSETQALAKEAEENELFREMQSDIVAQVMQRLAAVRA